MPSASRVAIAFSKADSDKRAAGSLADGFARAGLDVVQVNDAESVLALLAGEQRPSLIVAAVQLEQGGGEGLDLTRSVREKLGRAQPVEMSQPPVILVGDGDRRAEAVAAGATAFVPRPAYVKDIVTLAHIFMMPAPGMHPGWGGELGPLHMYYIVRALGGMQMTGVLSLMRGGRRGELRFFEGEVTSAQVGVLHGQSALHQLLLWPEATFDLRLESVVRRQQIPLSPADLLQDAERFLRDFNEMAGGMSPAWLYEQDLRRSAECVDQIPKEATPILRMFDGARSVADVIEESPLRMPETLKVVQNFVSLGAIRKLGAPRPHGDASAALLVEDWLVGQPEPRAQPGPEARPLRSLEPAARDWGDLQSASAGWDDASYAPVVPSHSATGEIRVAEPPADVEEPAPSAAASPGDASAPEAAPASARRGRERTVSGVVEAVEPATERFPRSPGAPAVEVASDLGAVVVPSPPAGEPAGFEAHEEKFFDQAAGEEPEQEPMLVHEETPPSKGFWKRLIRRATDRTKGK